MECRDLTNREAVNAWPTLEEIIDVRSLNLQEFIKGEVKGLMSWMKRTVLCTCKDSLHRADITPGSKFSARFDMIYQDQAA